MSETMQFLQTAVQAGGAILIVGLMGPGKAKLIHSLLAHRQAMPPLGIIDHRGGDSDISPHAIIWEPTSPQQWLNQVLSLDGTVYPIVHALLKLEHVSVWMNAASYHGGIATTYHGYFDSADLMTRWQAVAESQPLLIITLTKDSVDEPHIQSIVSA